MRRVILLVLTLLFTSPLWAQVVMQNGFWWTNPETRVDGTPLPPDELADTTMHCGLESGNYTMTASVGLSGQAAREDIIAAFDLDWDTVYFCALATTDTGGRRSAYSEERNFIVEPAAPSAPTWDYQ